MTALKFPLARRGFPVLTAAVCCCCSGWVRAQKIDLSSDADVTLSLDSRMEDTVPLAPRAVGAPNFILVAPNGMVEVPAFPDDPTPPPPDGKLAAETVRKLLADPSLTPAEEETNPSTAQGTPLSEESLKRLREFVTVAAKERRKLLEEETRQAVKELTEEIRPDAAAVEKLEGAAAAAVEASLKTWEEKCVEWLKPHLTEESFSEWVEQASRQTEIFAKEAGFKGIIAPRRTEAWKAGVNEILTPEQRERRGNEEEENRRKILEETESWLNMLEEQFRNQMTQPMQTRVEWIQQSLKLDGERRKRIEEAAERAGKGATAAWRKQAESFLEDTDAKFRERLVRQETGMSLDLTEKAYRPWEREEWITAQTEILTEEERRAVEEGRRAHRARRSVALAMLVLERLEDALGLSGDQFEKLMEPAARQMMRLPGSWFDPMAPGTYSGVNAEQLRGRLLATDPAVLAEVLTEGQLKRLKEMKPGRIMGQYYSVNRTLKESELPPPERLDERMLERLLSRLAHWKIQETGQDRMEEMEVKLEQLTRTVNPGAEVVAKLRTAAKGAAAETTRETADMIVNWMRGQSANVRNAKPADRLTRLKSFSVPNMDNRPRGAIVAEPERWKNALENLLTPEQKETWSAARTAREERRLASVLEMVLTDLEKQMPLTPEQITALRDQTGRALRKYEPDISGSLSPQWYMQSYYSGMPVALVPEGILEEIFSKEEITLLRERCLQHAKQFEEMIRQRHDARVNNGAETRKIINR